jgi:hypothetical protein
MVYALNHLADQLVHWRLLIHSLIGIIVIKPSVRLAVASPEYWFFTCSPSPFVVFTAETVLGAIDRPLTATLSVNRISFRWSNVMVAMASGIHRCRSFPHNRLNIDGNVQFIAQLAPSVLHAAIYRRERAWQVQGIIHHRRQSEDFNMKAESAMNHV